MAMVRRGLPLVRNAEAGQDGIKLLVSDSGFPLAREHLEPRHVFCIHLSYPLINQGD
jgi:hypothetical protein